MAELYTHPLATAESFSQPDNETNICFDDSGLNIKGISFHKLLEKLTSSESRDHNLVLDFLMTYRSFTSGGHELLNSLMVRERTTTAREVRISVFSIVTHWIAKYWYDFEKDCPELGILCLQWLDQVITEEPDGVGRIAQNLKDKLSRQLNPEKVLKIVSKNTKAELQPPTPIKPKDLNNFHILNCDAEEIARQLTLLDWQLYSSIKMYELVGQAWTKKDKATKAGNVLAMSTRFNYVSEWVSTCICMSEKIKERVKIVCKFIEIAQKLRQFNNFNGLMEVISGINRGPVHRLKATYEGVERVGKGLMASYTDLLSLTSSDHAYSTLRKAIRTANPPCIPYLGMYLTDITFIEEGNPNNIAPNNLINFLKRRKVAESIKDINTFQSVGYVFVPVTEIQDKLRGETTFDDEILYELSYYLEPRAGKPQPPKPKVLVDGLPTKREDKTKKLELEPKKEWNIFVIPDGPTNTIFNAGKYVIGLTLSKIIESITSGVPDNNTILTYLATLGLYTTPQAFLNMIITRFDVPPPRDKTIEIMQTYRDDIQTPIFLNVVAIIRLWITNFWHHFQRDEQLTETLIHFVNGLVAHSMPQFSVQLNCDIHKKLNTGPFYYRTVDPIPPPCPLVPVGIEPQYAEITDFDPIELARQFTLNHSSIWTEILAEDLLLRINPKNEQSSQLIDFLIDSSDSLVDWAVYELKKYQTKGQAYIALEFLGTMMIHFHNLQNWHGLNAIIISFNKMIFCNEWEEIKPEIKNFYNEYKELPNFDREHLTTIHKGLFSPCVPILRYFSETIDSLDSSYPKNMLTEQVINVERMVQFGEVILEAKRMQLVSYNFVVIPSIRDYIYNMRDYIYYFNACDEAKAHPFRSAVLKSMKDVFNDEEMKNANTSPVIQLVNEVVEEEWSLFVTEDVGNNGFETTDMISPENLDIIFPEKRIRNAVLSCFPSSKFGVICEYDEHCVVRSTPQPIKINVVYQGNDIVLLDIREHTSTQDIVSLLKIGKFFKGLNQDVRISCAVMTQIISEKAKKAANYCNIKILSCK